jgi:hypothetical protein
VREGVEGVEEVEGERKRFYCMVFEDDEVT